MNNNAIIGFRGKFFFLSNFYPVPVKYKGITYQNSEAAFQIDQKRSYILCLQYRT